MKRLTILVLAIVAIAVPAQARWKPEYAQADQATRDWFSTRELTKAAQQRFPFKSCCDNADVVKTEFRVDHNSGNDQWWWLANDGWREVPADIIHWGESAPNGQPVLFVVGTSPVCFFPPRGGL